MRQAQGDFSEGLGSPRRHQQAGALHLFDRRRLQGMAAREEALGEDEARAVMSFLVATLPRLFAAMSSVRLRAMLRELRPKPPGPCDVFS